MTHIQSYLCPTIITAGYYEPPQSQKEAAIKILLYSKDNINCCSSSPLMASGMSSSLVIILFQNHPFPSGPE